MCGITGILGFSPESVDMDELIEMNSFLKERGPDDEGYWCRNNVGFAHRRLSIVDLSVLGRQPMEDINNNCVITFNGEIYNFKELKKELVKEGAKLRSNSDTEVILEGYLFWGIDSLLERIDGMFAFALYDSRKKLVYLCRDRFGKKPLYFFNDGRYLKFSSDIRSISHTENDLSLDYESIDYYFTELSVPQPKTVWQKVRQIPPAHYLKIDLNNKNVNESKYWELDFNHKLDISLQEAEELIEKELTRAVVRRIHGDVPIGAFLSSGVDSGLVAALLAINSPKPIKTFTVGLSYEKYNEAPIAKQLAARYDTDHTEIFIEPEDLKNIIDKTIEYCGEPFADSSIIPSFYICQAISGSVKVALSGDGGDELFGGYYDFEYAFRADRYLRKTKNQNPLITNIGLLANKAAFHLGLTTNNRGIAADYQKFTGAERLYRYMGFSPKEKISLYTENFLNTSNNFTMRYLQEIWDSATKISITDNLLESSLKTRLLNDYLVKIDRASMMNSLEVRSPFLDHKLSEKAAQIPSSYLLHNGITKFLTKRIAKKYIDPEIFDRKKQGFGIPLKEWLRKDLYEDVKDVIYNFKLVDKGIVNKEYIVNIFKQHKRRRADHTNKIWALFCLESWLDKN